MTWRPSICYLADGICQPRKSSIGHATGSSDWVPSVIEPLEEIALAVQQRHPYHRQPQVGGAPEGIAGEDAKPAAIRRDMTFDGDLHREIGNGRECHRGIEHEIDPLYL